MKILVAYDGTLSAKDALRHGLQRVREKGGELIALHVFNRDILPYYDASLKVNEKLASEADRTVNEAEGIAREEGKGLKVTIVHREGSPEREILSLAKNEKIDLLLCPLSFKSLVRKYSVIMQQRGMPVPEAAGEAVAHTTKS